MGNVTERMCANCDSEIDHVEDMIMVNDDSYLCDSFCLGEFLQTHGLVALQGVE